MMTEHEAVDRARQIAEEQGWARVEPAQTAWHPAWSGHGGKWEIFSTAHGMGAKARVVLDAETGAVLEKGYVPR